MQRCLLLSLEMPPKCKLCPNVNSYSCAASGSAFTGLLTSTDDPARVAESLMKWLSAVTRMLDACLGLFVRNELDDQVSYYFICRCSDKGSVPTLRLTYFAYKLTLQSPGKACQTSLVFFDVPPEELVGNILAQHWPLMDRMVFDCEKIFKQLLRGQK